MNTKKIGGIRFLRLGRLQMSFCVCRPSTAARSAKSNVGPNPKLQKADTTTRITAKVLEKKLARLNARSQLSERLELDNAPCYGGWVLVNYASVQQVTPRMSAKEMSHYLDGALDWVAA